MRLWRCCLQGKSFLYLGMQHTELACISSWISSSFHMVQKFKTFCFLKGKYSVQTTFSVETSKIILASIEFFLKSCISIVHLHFVPKDGTQNLFPKIHTKMTNFKCICTWILSFSAYAHGICHFQLNFSSLNFYPNFVTKYIYGYKYDFWRGFHISTEMVVSGLHQIFSH
jgi:hypothetical protein